MSESMSSVAETKIKSPAAKVWRQFRRHVPAVVGSVVLIIMAVLVYLAPFIAPYEFDQMDLKRIREPPSITHFFGTDDLGRDLYTRILYGGRISLTIGILAALMGTFLGTVVGSIAGFYGGFLDNLLMRFTDVAISIPTLPLLIVLSSFTDADVLVMILIIGFLSWMPTARVVRSAVLSIRSHDYITSARVIGTRKLDTIIRHVIPNAMGPIIVGATLGVGNAIIIESSLSFLGLGVSPPTPTWGNMLQNAQSYMASKPWLVIFPGVAILITVLCINFIGEGLRDSLDPTVRQS